MLRSQRRRVGLALCAARVGYACEVIAPSVIPTRPGVQRTHDKRDAAHLARYYRAREHVVVRIPSEAEERVRVMMHCRETFQREILKSRHFILKFLALSRVGCNDWFSSNAALSLRSTGCALFQPLQTTFTLDDILVVPLNCP